MRARINDTWIELVHGDLTHQNTDAIVNAANSTLLGGGGVDGAIHRAAGPELLAECKTLGGCHTGDAKITRGYRLQARYVIHTVGPVYSERDAADAARLLANAHRRSLEIADEHGLQSVAFPAISTGVFGYPMAHAAAVALKTAIDFAAGHDGITLIRFVLFDQNAFVTFADALQSLAAQRDDLIPDQTSEAGLSPASPPL